MRCERAEDLIGPWLDGELDLDQRATLAEHIEGCRACAALAADYRRIGHAIAETAIEPPPRGLAARVRHSLAEAARSKRPMARSGGRLGPRLLALVRDLARPVATAAAVSLISVTATWWVITGKEQGDRLDQEIIAAHVRSLLQDSPIQIASADTHTVKPWFNGRIDYAPEVKDLAAAGFPLIGGRLDYVQDRRVGALVYRRHLHVINVFLWPAGSAEDSPPRQASRNGFNLIEWRCNGVAYAAISDLNAAELRQLQGLL